MCAHHVCPEFHIRFCSTKEALSVPYALQSDVFILLKSESNSPSLESGQSVTRVDMEV